MMGGHKTLRELEQELVRAGDKVEVGGVYCHYKNLEHPYTVVDLVILGATDEIAVVYAPSENPAVRFVRPLTSWLETVKLNGEPAPRFKKV